MISIIYKYYSYINIILYICFIGNRIIEIRISKEITQYRLAKNLMMEQSNLARIENCETNPTIKTL